MKDDKVKRMIGNIGSQPFVIFQGCVITWTIKNHYNKSKSLTIGLMKRESDIKYIRIMTPHVEMAK